MECAVVRACRAGFGGRSGPGDGAFDELAAYGDKSGCDAVPACGQGRRGQDARRAECASKPARKALGHALRPRIICPRKAWRPPYGREVIKALRSCRAALGTPTGKRLPGRWMSWSDARQQPISRAAR